MVYFRRELKMDRVILRTYGGTWKFEIKIYSIGNVTLPVPVPPSEAAYFVLAFLFMILLSKILPFLSVIPFVLKYIVVPFLIMQFLTKKKLDGKSPHKFLLGYLEYTLVQPKCISRFQPFSSYAHGSFSPVAYRKTKIVDLAQRMSATKIRKEKR